MITKRTLWLSSDLLITQLLVAFLAILLKKLIKNKQRNRELEKVLSLVSLIKEVFRSEKKQKIWFWPMMNSFSFSAILNLEFALRRKSFSVISELQHQFSITVVFHEASSWEFKILLVMNLKSYAMNFIRSNSSDYHVDLI